MVTRLGECQMVTPAISTWIMQRDVQRILALFTFLVVAMSHYLLSRLPVPVTLVSTGPLLTDAVSELVIDQRLDQPRPFLVFEGEVGDAVDLRFDRAQLEARSAQLLKQLGVTLPAGAHPMSLLTGRAAGAKTFIQINVVPVAGEISRITLSSPQEAGDSGLVLILRADGARIAVNLLSSGGASPNALPPQRTLHLAGKTLPVLSGAVPLSMLAASGSEIRLRIVPTAHDWSEVPRLTLAPADPNNAALTAIGLGVRTGHQTQFSDYVCAKNSYLPLVTPGLLAQGQCTAGKNRLQLVSLGFRSGLVSMQASGHAWERRNNEVHTLDLISWLKDNPMLATLIGAFDAAVLAWCKRAFSPSESKQLHMKNFHKVSHSNHPPKIHSSK